MSVWVQPMDDLPAQKGFPVVFVFSPGLLASLSAAKHQCARALAFAKLAVSRWHTIPAYDFHGLAGEWSERGAGNEEDKSAVLVETQWTMVRV